MRTDSEIQVPTVENLVLSSVLHLRPGISQNVAMQASAITVNDKFLSLCPLCPNYFYAVTVGVADGGVADAINILHLSLSSFSSFFFFLPIYISS